MRAVLIAICLVLPLAARAAPAASGADEAAIERVISAQLDAFRHDDGAAAFGYASPHIQSLFGNPSTFLDMVRQGYPPVYRSRSVSFGALADEGGQLVQHVELVGPDGADAIALYTMQREPDGTWRIDGCELVRSERIET